MEIKRKTLTRENWPRVLQSQFCWRKVQGDGFDGIAATIRFDAIRAPLTKVMQGRAVRILDHGYRWLQLAPKGEHWWLTVMFDERGKIVQYYFDVTLQNVIQDGESFFWDLFLDVVMLPDGSVFLLDRDELDQALTEGVVDAAQHERALETAGALMRALPEHLPALERFCHRCADSLRAMEKHDFDRENSEHSAIAEPHNHSYAGT